MLLFYYNKKRDQLPYNLTHELFVDRPTAKNTLKEYYKNNEGKDRIMVGIYDEVVNKDTGDTLVDLLHQYVDFSFVDVYIFSNKKDYYFENATHNFIGVFSNNLQERINRATATNPKCKIHIIDDEQYFFLSVGEM